jgi:hypothetical protein
MKWCWNKKVGQNKSAPMQKWTKLDKKINLVTLIVFIIQFTLIISLGSVGTIWRHRHDHTVRNHQLPSLPFLHLFGPLKGNNNVLMMSCRLIIDVSDVVYSIIIR